MTHSKSSMNQKGPAALRLEKCKQSLRIWGLHFFAGHRNQCKKYPGGLSGLPQACTHIECGFIVWCPPNGPTCCCHWGRMQFACTHNICVFRGEHLPTHIRDAHKLSLKSGYDSWVRSWVSNMQIESQATGTWVCVKSQRCESKWNLKSPWVRVKFQGY